MSRPTKQGIDYFPLDCQFDNETELLISEQGGIAVSVLVTVWQLIYQNNGYYIIDNDDLYLLIRKRIMIDVDIIKTVIKSAIKRGIFCTKKHKKYKILTSRGIQSRYVIASRLKKNINIVKNYLCIDVSNVGNYTYVKVNGDVNATKEEVEEEEEEEVKYIKKKVNKFIPPTQEDVINYFIEKGYKKETAIKAFNYYDVASWKDSKGNQVKNWKQKMNGVWFKDENKEPELNKIPVFTVDEEDRAT